MQAPDRSERPVVDWLTVVAIAAIATSLTVAFHEGIHALTCALVGGDLQEYSALHVLCQHGGIWQIKVVDASASLANILLGSCHGRHVCSAGRPVTPVVDDAMVPRPGLPEGSDSGTGDYPELGPYHRRHRHSPPLWRRSRKDSLFLVFDSQRAVGRTISCW